MGNFSSFFNLQWLCLTTLIVMYILYSAIGILFPDGFGPILESLDPEQGPLVAANDSKPISPLQTKNVSKYENIKYKKNIVKLHFKIKIQQINLDLELPYNQRAHSPIHPPPKTFFGVMKIRIT